MAYIINVPKVSAVNLADRLLTISRRESIDIDLGTLIQLAEKSGCDIRTCLGTLQYMGKDYGKVDVNVGVKDTKKTIFESWREILQTPMNNAGPLTVRQRVQRILHVVHGESSERLAQGVFENYPQNCPDAIRRVSTSLEWFQYYDEVTTVVNARQDWTVAPYVNYAFVSWHLGFAGMTNPKLSYPYAAGEVHQKLTKSMAILTASRKTKGQDTETIVLDIAPFLFELLNPKLRSVATNLYSAKEKEELRRLINVMLDIGVAFVQQKSEDGAIDYQIEPNLYEIGVFPNCKLRRGLSYAAKQMVAQELELERLARAAITTGASTSTESSKDMEKEASKAEFIPSANAFRPNHLNEVERIVTPKANRYRNFFENFKKKPEEKIDAENPETSPKPEKAGKKYRNLIAKYGVWYKYREGFSNSIRRNVSLEDLL